MYMVKSGTWSAVVRENIIGTSTKLQREHKNILYETKGIKQIYNVGPREAKETYIKQEYAVAHNTTRATQTGALVGENLVEKAPSMSASDVPPSYRSFSLHLHTKTS